MHPDKKHMTVVETSIRRSKTARWMALGLVSFTMLMAYFFVDVMAPLKTMLETQLGWTSSDYGFFSSAYGWFNVFFFMLILGGLMLDKMGIRFSGMTSASFMLVGALIKYYAVSSEYLLSYIIWGINAQVMLAAIGFAIFGVGAEVAGVAANKIAVKWFKGRELALAMGVLFAFSRTGTLLAMSVPVPFARLFHTLSAPLLLGVVALCVGLLSFFLYTFMDKRLDAALQAENAVASGEGFRLSDIKQILSNKGFWLISSLCVLFYACVFPFLKYATDFMVNKFRVDLELAGLIPGLLPFGTIVLSPLFGRLHDKKGKGASIMIVGSVVLFMVHVLFAVPFLNNWVLAVVLMAVLGVVLSLVPAALWPSVAKIIPEKQLGTAYALVYWVQNIGFIAVPFAVGMILENFCKISPVGAPPAYDYTLVMVFFSLIALMSVFFAIALKKEDARKKYGLE